VRFPAVSWSVLLLSCLVATACGGGATPNSSSTTPPVQPPPPPACTGGSNASQFSTTLATPPAGVIPPEYFGFNLHPAVSLPGNNEIPWPTILFGAVRLWATETNWNDLNPKNGVYDFSNLDTTLSVAEANNQTDFIYTFGVVPPWASSNPNDQTCVTANSPPGSCDAPSDLNADGSGPDMLWQTFVRALVSHANGQIKYWEIWNEPDVLEEWSGTDAQMVRMAEDAYTIIKAANPSFLVTTPTTVNAGSGQSISSWLPGYLATQGTQGAPANFADIVTFHGYVDPCQSQSPETEIANVGDVTSSISGVGALSSKPLWDTEGAWGADAKLTDPDMETAYLARMYLLQWSMNVSRFYWFQYGNQQTGTLWTPSGGLDEAGIAYGHVYNWMVGATLTDSCSATGTVWTCTFTNGSLQEQAVWDTSQSCSNGACTTSTYTLPPNSVYTSYEDLAGNTTSVSGGTVQIGAKPILLVNQ